MVGLGPGGVEHAPDLHDAANREGAWRHALGPGVQREVRDSRQLQRVRDLRHLEAREARARADLSVPRIAERRIRLQESAVHVGGSDQQPSRLRLRRGAGSGEQGPRTRHPGLRYPRHRASEAPRKRADLPRVAHPHARHAAGRQR